MIYVKMENLIILIHVILECIDGQWVEIIIDCAEWFGVPCEGGIYVAPPEGVCCSTCVQFGDVNQDDTLNVIDIVQMVNIILSNELILFISPLCITRISDVG